MPGTKRFRNHTRVYWSFKNGDSSYLETIKRSHFIGELLCVELHGFLLISALPSPHTSFSSPNHHFSSIFMEEVDESEASWFDGSVEELIHELLDDESPLFVPPEVPESKEVDSQKSVINKLISSVYSGPTIRDIQSALSMSFQHGRTGSQAVISFPEKGSGKMENKYTLRIKSCGNGLADDGYKWRKYGQKSIKSNPNPRSISAANSHFFTMFTIERGDPEGILFFHEQNSFTLRPAFQSNLLHPRVLSVLNLLAEVDPLSVRWLNLFTILA